MHRIRLTAAALLCAALTSACYRVTVTTGAAPAATVVDKPWANGFVFGLVPPPPVDVAQECPGGNVSKVVTQQSFLNGLATAVTWNIYTPMQITVTCAARRTGSLGAPETLVGPTKAAAEASAK